MLQRTLKLCCAASLALDPACELAAWVFLHGKGGEDCGTAQALRVTARSDPGSTCAHVRAVAGTVERWLRGVRLCSIAANWAYILVRLAAALSYCLPELL